MSLSLSSGRHRSWFYSLPLFLSTGSQLLPANPTGGQVAAGAASINSVPGTVTVHQGSQNAIINWQSFSIGAGELTKFIQPSSTSAVLNRVLGGQTSLINGTLSANGQVYLINGNGILIGSGGMINTAGFTASTRDIADNDFLSGQLHFTGSNDAGVQNLGQITALGGNVVLIGKTVDNQGTINAPSGTAGLVAGDDVLLAQANADGSTITVNPVAQPSPASTKIGVRNSGSIMASSAELKAANGNIYALAIQNQGLIRATTLQHQGGHIYLTSDTGTIVNAGTLDASAQVKAGKGGLVILKSAHGQVIHSGKILARGGLDGAGGRAEISGAKIQFAGTVDLTAPGGQTGDLLLDPTSLDVITGGSGTVTGGQNDSTSSTIDPTTVEAALGTANLTLNADQTITVTDGVAWASANTLTLSTNTVGSTITINAPITASNAAGGLTINTAGAGDAVTTGAGGTINVADFILQSGAWTQNSGTLPAFTASQNFEITGGTFLRVTGGTGTTGNPYQIADIYGLQGLEGFLASNADLVANIDATETTNWNSGAGFVPIGNNSTAYSGVFNGQGHVINNLTIDLPGQTSVGLFGIASGVLENIGLNNVDITGGTYVGGLVGALGNGTPAQPGIGVISDAFSTGSVVGGNYVGGLDGLNHGTSISDSFSGGTVNGGSFVGGLIGSSLSPVTNTYSTADVTASGGPVGGLVGENYYGGTVVTSYSSGTVTGSSEFGGLVGRNLSTINGSFWDTDTSGITSPTGGVGSGTNAGVTGETTADLLQESTYSGAGWNIGTNLSTNIWVILNGETRPLLSMEYSTTITNGHQLQLIGLNTTTLAANYVLGNDITVDSANPAEVWGTSFGNGGGFVPIGITTFDIGSATPTGGTAYSGTFNGQNFTIDSPYINLGTSNSIAVGLFSNLSGTIENVGVTDEDIAGYQDVGGLVGASGGTVKNCYTTGEISGGYTYYVGGLVGNNGGTVQNDYSTASVFGENGGSGAGGLIGGNAGLVETSYSGGEVDGDIWVGGLVGFNQNGTITNCYSTGPVTGSTDVGGLVGHNGYGGESGTIQTTYSISYVTGTTNVGGLVGATDSGTIADSYYATDSSPPEEDGSAGEHALDVQTQSVSSGPQVGVGANNDGTTISYLGVPATDVTGLTLAQMRHASSFDSAWDFVNVWTTDDDTTTPLLRALAVVPPVTPPPPPPPPPTPPAGTPSTDAELAAAFDAMPYTSPERQNFATFEGEFVSVQEDFANDPFNGLDVIDLMSESTPVRLAGDLTGAINDVEDSDDLVFQSSTSSFASLSRLVTPGMGVVTIVDGTVQVGCPATGETVLLDSPMSGCLPSDAIQGLRNVLASPVYNQLRPLIYGHY